MPDFQEGSISMGDSQESSAETFSASLIQDIERVIVENSSPDQKFQVDQEQRFQRLTRVYGLLGKDEFEASVASQSGGRQSDRDTGVTTGWQKRWDLNVDGRIFSVFGMNVSQNVFDMYIEEYEEAANKKNDVGVVLLERKEEFKGIPEESRFGSYSNLNKSSKKLEEMGRRVIAEIALSSPDNVGFIVRQYLNGSVGLILRDSNSHFFTEEPVSITANELIGEINRLKVEMKKLTLRPRVSVN